MNESNEASKLTGWWSWWASRNPGEQQVTLQQDTTLSSAQAESTAAPDSPNSFQPTVGTPQASANDTGEEVPISDNVNGSWYNSIVSKVSSIGILNSRNDDLNIAAGSHYSQLTESQIKRLGEDAIQKVAQRTNTWCWFENLTRINDDTKRWSERSGVISVHGTGSEHCILPLRKYPIPDKNPGYNIYLRDSLIIPSSSPLEVLHTQSLPSKVAMTVKNYYNFPNERHLYLKKNTDGILRSKKVLIISVVGNLPEKYEKQSLGEQRSAYYLSRKLAQSIEHEVPSSIFSLSLECPLDSKDIETVFTESTALLNNWKHIFAEVSSIFFVSVYHSVPLAISLAKHILENHQSLQFDATIPVGLLAIESNLQGYRFWDHSSDAINVDEQNYQKMQQAKEKQLFQGVGKNEREILSNIRHYRKLDSKESKRVQHDLDWLLYHWSSFRLNLFGRIYDNFMTATQKLAVNYSHPKIIRNLWCDGRYLGHDLKHLDKLGVPDVDIKTPNFECAIQVPQNRLFEITLLNDILLALNLGHTKFVPILKLLSPYFISRSFNEYTVSPNLRKQTQSELKSWLQDMDVKWRTTNSSNQPHDELPETVSSVHKFLEFALYHDTRNPELVKFHSDIYDDDMVYKNFIENTLKTRSPLIEKHLALLSDHSGPQSILNTVNQYDLVWKFHEFVSDYATLYNLPRQHYPPELTFSISLDYSHWQPSYADPTMFHRNNQEAINRLKQIWVSYQDWDPPTRGLKQLKNILSVLSLYSEASQLLQDIVGK